MCVFDYPPKKAIGLYCFNLLGNLFQATSTDQRIACSFEPPGITKQERDHQFASNIGFWGFLGPRKSLVEPRKSLAEPRKSLVEPRCYHAVTTPSHFFCLKQNKFSLKPYVGPPGGVKVQFSWEYFFTVLHDNAKAFYHQCTDENIKFGIQASVLGK